MSVPYLIRRMVERASWPAYLCPGQRSQVVQKQGLRVPSSYQSQYRVYRIGSQAAMRSVNVVLLGRGAVRYLYPIKDLILIEQIMIYEEAQQVVKFLLEKSFNIYLIFPNLVEMKIRRYNIYFMNYFLFNCSLNTFFTFNRESFTCA